MPVDAVGLEGIKGQTRTYLSNINLDDVSRRNHNRILFEMASLFRSMRSIKHKKILVR